MPTWESVPRFWRDYDKLTKDQKEVFQDAVRLFREGLAAGGQFHPSLRVHHVQGTKGIYSMTWDSDGDSRATFQYGQSIQEAEPHIIWRRVGTHDIYRLP